MGAGNHRGDNSAIQAVIFDLDGVLLDSEWSAFEAWKDVARFYGGALEDSVFPLVMGTAQEVTAEIVMEQTGVSFPMQEACDMAWKRAIERLKAGVSPMPGSEALVRTLDARRCPIAIASNSLSHYIDTAVEGLKMGAFFRVRVGVDQVAQGKPAPDVYLTAAERLGIAPKRCLAIEDSRVGVRAAAAAGMRVIAVPDRLDENPTSGYADAWRMYPSLVDVHQALDEIFQEE
jgi:HAD superfamily hydrolase (TIGR01509 family)